ncbi:MAG TPA: hypothetical protein VMA35_08270 [Candidatus Sulfopaludibacter sp.]|nr:hypothetical protein [Candidatus Sulfopaludibacter sp.]
MKTQTRQGRRRFQLKIMSYGNSYYIDQTTKLERVLARKPREIRIDMIGAGEIPADSALLIRSVLMTRSPKTRIITNARSSLQGGSVLVWLLGDQRLIRDDARVFFKRNPLADENPVEVYAGLGATESEYKDSYSSIDPEDADYTRVLKLIDEFLPVRQFAGRIVNVNMLLEFGLVDNPRVGAVRATVFSKSREAMVAT